MRLLMKAFALNLLAWFVFLLLLLGAYFFFFRHWQMNWGATHEDITRAMAGDELLQYPEFNATRAVVINAPPERIWPWIVQMGYKRAGFYGFDKLDNGGMPSATQIIPEFQNLKVGDFIPGGEYKGQLYNLLEVVEVIPNHSMLWIFVKGTPWEGATWSWGLYKIDTERTRLVSRLRQKYSYDTFQEVIACSVIDAVEIMMMRTTLRGIKKNAEQK